MKRIVRLCRPMRKTIYCIKKITQLDLFKSQAGNSVIGDSNHHLRDYRYGAIKVELTPFYDCDLINSIVEPLPLTSVEDTGERLLKTSQGPVRGFRDSELRDVYCFYGIPYATAPTGQNRFKAPLPAPVWLQALEAVDKGIICPQSDLMASLTGPNPKVQEDCLLANVYIPDAPETDLPVVVYVHGGGYQMGSGNMMTPKHLVSSKKVIAVTFNYRLGVHGFLCLGTKDVPGNAGMKDQVALLRWVKKNIASYGGNPDDVTIAGYSAGSSSVDLLMLSKTTRGLFNKVILESGANLAVWSVQQEPLETAKMFARQLNFTNVDDVYALEDFYKHARFDQISSASDWFLSRPDSSFVFTPCVERDTGAERFLDDAPINILNSGKYPKVPLLYGFSNMEGIMRVTNTPLTRFSYQEHKETMNQKFSDYLPADLQFENEEEKEQVANEVKAFYFKGKPIGDDTILDYINYFTDVIFAYGTLRTVTLHVERDHDKIYLYEYAYPYDYEVPGSSPKKTVTGADHCAQTMVVLDSEFKGLPISNDPIGEIQKMKDLMRELWINFITTGAPVPADSRLPQWPPVGDKDCSPHMELNVTPKLRGPLLPERKQFWDRIYAKHYRTPSPPPTPPSRHSEL